MTATRMGILARAGTGILLIAAWVWGGTRLWRTSVPSSLDVSGLDVHRYFSEQQLAEAHRFTLFVDLDWVLATAAAIVALVVLARRAPRLSREIGLGPVGSGIVVGMVVLVTLWFVALPFAVAEHWWAARHGLAPSDWLAWLAEPWEALAVEAGYALVAIAVVMGLARRLGRRWWVVGAPVFIALAISFAFLQGYVAAGGTTPLQPGLRAGVAVLEQRVGVDVPVREQKVSDWTTEANAFSAGLGPSARVVLWDTLLDGRFSRGEVDVVVAHELGHIARNHIWKGLGWVALLAFPAAFGIEAATRRGGGLGNPGAIPLAFLVLTLASIAALPIENAVSRRYEAEADWVALQTTHDPVAARKLFQGFERTSLQQPSPPGWDYWLLENHPTLAQRIAMAERWRQASRTSASRSREGEPRGGS